MASAVKGQGLGQSLQPFLAYTLQDEKPRVTAFAVSVITAHQAGPDRSGPP